MKSKYYCNFLCTSLAANIKLTQFYYQYAYNAHTWINCFPFVGVKTIFAGSSCNDLVTIHGTNIVSGHFDKRVRFWDSRVDSNTNEILLQGRLTSLDLSPGTIGLLHVYHLSWLNLCSILQLLQIFTSVSQSYNFNLHTLTLSQKKTYIINTLYNILQFNFVISNQIGLFLNFEISKY